MSVTHNQTATKNTHPFTVVCNKLGCEWRTAHSTMEVAVRTDATHPCPYKVLKRKYMTGVLDDRGQEYTPPNRGKTLAEQAWDKLDEMFDWLMRAAEADEPADHWEALGWCRALAWTIHSWTPHYYKTMDDVTRQAVKRRQMKLGELEWAPTPGYQYNPMPLSHAEYARINKETYAGEKLGGTPSPAQKVMPKKAAPVRVKPDDIETIKHGLDHGFTVEDLAKMLGYPETVIQSYA